MTFPASAQAVRSVFAHLRRGAPISTYFCAITSRTRMTYLLPLVPSLSSPWYLAWPDLSPKQSNCLFSPLAAVLPTPFSQPASSLFCKAVSFIRPGVTKPFPPPTTHKYMLQQLQPSKEKLSSLELEIKASTRYRSAYLLFSRYLLLHTLHPTTGSVTLFLPPRPPVSDQPARLAWSWATSTTKITYHLPASSSLFGPSKSVFRSLGPPVPLPGPKDLATHKTARTPTRLFWLPRLATFSFASFPLPA